MKPNRVGCEESLLLLTQLAGILLGLFLLEAMLLQKGNCEGVLQMTLTLLACFLHIINLV